jgi:hypothetical protein
MNHKFCERQRFGYLIRISLMRHTHANRRCPDRNPTSGTPEGGARSSQRNFDVGIIMMILVLTVEGYGSNPV